jgi:hypothetical protein
LGCCLRWLGWLAGDWEKERGRKRERESWLAGWWVEREREREREGESWLGGDFPCSRENSSFAMDLP